MTAAPFEELPVVDNTITIDSDCSKLVIFTDNKMMIPAFNENINDPDRLANTPCGGVKNTVTPDLFPGTLSVSGNGCYLKSLSGKYSGKWLSAGQMAEYSEIVTSGSKGCAFSTADGKEFRTADGKSFLVTPLNTIVSKCSIQNISNSDQTCTVTIRCPNSVNSINLYNLDTCAYETISVTNVQQTYGTVNSYTFSQTIPSRSSKRFQVMVNYSTLAFTFKFSNDAVAGSGLNNAESWIAYYDPADTHVNFLLFTKTPTSLTCLQDASGNVTQITITTPSATVYKGRVNDFSVIQNLLKGFKAVPQSTATITSYVVPSISDEKILPKYVISSSYLGSTISKRMSPGEYSCASFVLTSDKDVNLSILPSNLTSGSNSIAASNIDLKYVKCWWQAGNATKNTHVLGKYLTPELLLKDDSLVQAWGDSWSLDSASNPAGRNYLKLSDGSYINISDGSTQGGTSSTNIPISERPVYDSNYLQVLNLPSNYNKQVWITFYVPAGTPTGTYTGSLTIRSGFTILKTISLSVTVLPITLLSPANVSPIPIEYSLYYRGKLAADDAGTISSEIKSQTQFLAEHIDMVKHGITNPTLMTHTTTTLPTALNLRTQAGMSNSKLYYNGTINIDDSIEDIQSWKNTCTANGVSQLYIYGYDESSLDTTEIRAKMTAIHNIGVKIFCAQGSTLADSVHDILDLAITSSATTSTTISHYHSSGNKIYSYGNPQAVPEFPRIFRQNYGLVLWQMNYDGEFTYAYQHGYLDIWNDFDSSVYRDHVLAYPTANGIIDTIQFEGLREGVNDVRYLATLQAAITAHPGSNATTANNWLTTLKSTDLTTVDLDAVRSQMIDYILAITGA